MRGHSTSATGLVPSVSNLVLIILSACAAMGRATELFSIEMENFYGWNLPFAKTVSASANDGVLSSLGNINYLLNVDFNSYFSVIFTEVEFTTDSSINYSIIEMSPFILEGTW
jgi:hypothetical protein